MRDQVRTFIWWFTRHAQGLCLWLALMFLCALIMTTAVVKNYLEEQHSHEKMHYDNDLMRFLLLEKQCSCCPKEKKDEK